MALCNDSVNAPSLYFPPKGLVTTIGMLESMWVFTTVERGNFTRNWLRTILFVYDFWPFPGHALNVHCTLRPPPSPQRKSDQQLASFQARLWGFTTILLINFAPLHFIHWSVKPPTRIVVKLPKAHTTTINVFTSPLTLSIEIQVVEAGKLKDCKKYL